MKANSSSGFLVFLLFMSFLLQAQESEKEIVPVPDPKSFITEHQIVNGGKTIRYKATAAETYLKDDKGEAVASIWSVAYTKTGVTDPSTRPVTFIFNGGPGSASVWLHMGLFGPKLVKVVSDASEDDGAAPYPVVENTMGILDVTDLVFIDPVGTGYSRVIGKGKVEDYWGLMEDARSIASLRLTPW